MSIYGHYTEQYYGNKIEFPKESFLISGTSYYKENCKEITYSTELIMEEEKENKYDNFAIVIKNKNKIIGYVPKTEVRELCRENIIEKLKIINIKMVDGNYGLRVIPSRFYVYDKTLNREISFTDR